MSPAPHPHPPGELPDQAPVALSVLDCQARLLYYNGYAPSILDRRPEYLGRDVRDFHQPASAARISEILAAYAQGQRREFAWTLERQGQRLAVRVAPWIRDGQWAGVLHAVMLLP
jgi:DUF438 domain-containing protein